MFKVTVIAADNENFPKITREFPNACDFITDQDTASQIHYGHFWTDQPPSRDLIRTIESKWPCSVFVISHEILKWCADPAVPKVAVFDLDSTLIQMEVIDALAALKPEIGPQVAQITEDSMAGKIDFRESLKQRVSLLKGIPIEDAWKHIKETVKFTSGAFELFQNVLHAQNGWTTAVLSGGFLPIADWVKQHLNLSEACANRLQVDSHGLLTGELEPGHAMLDSKAKEFHLSRLMDKTGAKLSLAVGDGANDLLMLKLASLGIAFNAKPIVQDQANYRLNHPNIYALYYILNSHS
jgi:phosphoserine phosphatase